MKIFISYAWADKDKVEHIDNFFKSIGINLVRDIRDLAFLGNIKEFMNRVQSADYVLMLISESYIKSKNCMYEVLEFLKSDRISERIIPLISDDINVFNLEDQAKIIEFWKKKKQEQIDIANSVIDITVDSEFIREEILHSESIYRNIGAFFSLLTSMRCGNLESERIDNYKNVLFHIGIKQNQTFQLVSKMYNIEELEIQHLELEKLLVKFPKNKDVLFAAGYLNQIAGNYVKAEYYYSDLLRFNENAQAHYNLGLIYDQWGHGDTAMLEWNKALEVQDFFFDADYQVAKNQFDQDETIIRLEKLRIKYPLEIRVYEDLASRYFESEDYFRTEKIALEALGKFPNQSYFHELLSHTYYSNNLFNEALVSIESSLEIEYTKQRQLHKERVLEQTKKGAADFWYLYDNTNIDYFKSNPKKYYLPENNVGPGKVSIYDPEIFNGFLSVSENDSLPMSQGDIVLKGDILAYIGSSKKRTPVIAEENGIFLRYLITHGEQMKSNTAICIINRIYPVDYLDPGKLAYFENNEDYLMVRSPLIGTISIVIEMPFGGGMDDYYNITPEYVIMPEDYVEDDYRYLSKNQHPLYRGKLSKPVLTRKERVELGGHLFSVLAMGLMNEVEFEEDEDFEFVGYLVEHGEAVLYDQPVCVLKRL